jgi:acyl carrier protein
MAAIPLSDPHSEGTTLVKEDRSEMTPGAAASHGAMTQAEALDWIAEMFEEPKGRISSDTARSEIPAWDSLGHLILMSALDQQFGIRLTPAEVSSLASVKDILDILSRHQRLH